VCQGLADNTPEPAHAHQPEAQARERVTPLPRLRFGLVCGSCPQSSGPQAAKDSGRGEIGARTCPITGSGSGSFFMEDGLVTDHAPSSHKSRRPYVVAMVLGTALSALPAAQAAPPERAVTDISRYCTACWRNAHLPPSSWNDCTQEVFRRLLE